MYENLRSMEILPDYNSHDIVMYNQAGIKFLEENVEGLKMRGKAVDRITDKFGDRTLYRLNDAECRVGDDRIVRCQSDINR